MNQEPLLDALREALQNGRSEHSAVGKILLSLMWAAFGLALFLLLEYGL